ncbi:glycosyltransferase family 2 protein [Streptococcus suis]|uniref:glycosyltransferase family 2 protein n=1 Tax=Streptococcus suis TaxID=1307 RepID=UPI002117F925|nr:glycosyltransferase family A protein [Streptococcus suis]MCQ8263678.1 glycosyltransferase family 2 protein [Streptococcus suis]
MSEKTQPSVTVLIPVYNGEEHIGDCLDSLLKQSYDNYQIVVVNDGSRDKTLEKLQQYPVKILSYEENKGISYALNYGIDHIDTDYIIRMDADDLAHYDRIRIQVNFMENNPQVFMSGCTSYPGPVHGNKWEVAFGERRLTTFNELRTFYLFHPYLLHPGVIFRTKSWKEKGYRYDSRFDGVEDFELHRRIIMEEEVYLLHLHLIHVRAREGSASSVPQSVTLERLNRVNRHFYQSHGVPYEGDMLYLGKTMFPATYSTSRAELEKAENFACQLLEVDYFKQRLKRDIIKPLFAYLYQIARE